MPDTRPVNPPDIVDTMPDGEGFSIDTNNMDVGQMYLLEYQGDRFEIEKRDDGALVVYEVVTMRDWPRFAWVTLMRILRRR